MPTGGSALHTSAIRAWISSRSWLLAISPAVPSPSNTDRPLDGLAAQQKMHVETSPGQHQAIEASNSSAATDADAWCARMHADFQVKVSFLFTQLAHCQLAHARQSATTAGKTAC